jgi:muramoyltetrapeptide carboxypeptidase
MLLKYNIPVVYNFPAGHIRDNRALVMGSIVHLDVSAEKSVLEFVKKNLPTS